MPLQRKNTVRTLSAAVDPGSMTKMGSVSGKGGTDGAPACAPRPPRPRLC